MISGFHKRNRLAARSLAMLGATLVLFAQIIGAIHFHEATAPRDGIAAAHSVVDQGLCPVCQLAFHSPGSIAAAPSFARGTASSEAIVLFESSALESPVFSTARVRAPPTPAV